jgi:hypothetical protein
VRFVGSTGSTLQYVVLILVETRRIRSPVDRRYGSRRARCRGANAGKLSGWWRWNGGLTVARRLGHSAESADYLRAIAPSAASSMGTLADFRGASL